MKTMYSVVVVDIEGFRLQTGEYIIKEFACCSLMTDEICHIFPKPPFPFYELSNRDKSQCLWTSRNLHHIPWNRGEVDYNTFLRMVSDLPSKFDAFFAKGITKCRHLEDIFGVSFHDIDCANVVQLQEPGVTCKVHWSTERKHCALQKASAYAKWLKSESSIISLYHSPRRCQRNNCKLCTSSTDNIRSELVIDLDSSGNDSPPDVDLMLLPSNKTQGFDLNSVPDHHYHLGGSKFLVISDFTGKIRVDLRSYQSDGTSYFPTKFGITFSPAAFRDLMTSIYQISNHRKAHIFQKELLVSCCCTKNGPLMCFQRIYGNNANLLDVIPRGVMLSPEQFKELEDVCGKAWHSIKQLVLGSKFKEAAMGNRLRARDCMSVTEEGTESRLLLRQVVTREIEKKIVEIFYCDVCNGHRPRYLSEEQYAHECTMTDMWMYHYNEAIALLEPKMLGKAFADECNRMKHFITEEYLNNIDGDEVLTIADTIYGNRW